jgi:hypothetical protein
MFINFHNHVYRRNKPQMQIKLHKVIVLFNSYYYYLLDILIL